MLEVDEHRKKKFHKKVGKIQFHQKLYQPLLLFSHIDEKKRLWKILRNHVWKLISRYEDKVFHSDTIIDLERGNIFFLSHVIHVEHYSPMSDVEKTKRSEYSLHPYRFLLNRKMATINQLIMSWANRTKNDDSLSFVEQWKGQWSLHSLMMSNEAFTVDENW